MPHLCQGRIVWSVVPDKNGKNAYPRPVVILTPTAEIATATELIGVVASNTAAHRQPRPPTYIELPYQPNGRVRTKLKKPTVVVCEWLAPIDPSSLSAKDIGGIVDGDLLELIVRTVISLHQGPSAT